MLLCSNDTIILTLFYYKYVTVIEMNHFKRIEWFEVTTLSSCQGFLNTYYTYFLHAFPVAC